MAVDESQLEAAVSAVREPEIGLSLGDLGLVRSVRSRRRRGFEQFEDGGSADLCGRFGSFEGSDHAVIRFSARSNTPS